ncbi:putative nucleotidyltransferase, ribonuclease H [Tanacetum coccineum]
MTKLAFCDYHNMVAILEKTESNTDFHQIVDFLEASHIRYALTVHPTVYVSHIQQFWSTARVETVDGETKIIAKVNGRQRTVTESSIRRHLKLLDDEGINTFPDNEVLENLSLMGYNISSNQRFSFQKGQFSHQWKFLIHTIMQCLSLKSTGFNEFSSNIATAIVCLATNRVYNFSKMIFDGMVRNIQKDQTTSPEPIPQATTLPSQSYPRISTPRRLTREAIRISQSKAPTPGADEIASPTRDDRHGEAFPTATSLDAGQDRENITKTSAMPHEASPGVTSLSGGEGRGMDQGEDLMTGDVEKSTGKGSDNTDEAANVLSTLEAANVLSSGSFPTAAPAGVATASGSFPTATIFTTANVTTPYTRSTRASREIIIEPSHTTNVPTIRAKGKGKEKMVESTGTKKNKIQEQLDAQVAKELEMEFAREEQLIKDQGEKDAEIATAQAEKELGIMIAELDRSNELIAKYMTEYEQAEADLSLEEKMELITELIKYQRNLAEIKKYQAQQSKPSTKTEKRNFYMAVLKSHAGWKKSERVKRPGIQLAQESSKRLKTAKASGSEPSQEHQTKDSKELSEEELKKMMKIVPVEEVYIEALQAKYPIREWEIYSKEQRKYWKIIRVGNHTEVYQTFEEMLKRIDREDLDRLWSLVKKTFNTTDPTEDKEKELWVELKRLYEPDPKDQLWALQRYMHDPLEWRLYDTCGVHHVSTERGHDIFMLVEKDYPLTKGLTTLLLCNKGSFCYKGSLVITEYLVNISKRLAFWSLNEDILKITILKTNMPYPSRKIRHFDVKGVPTRGGKTMTQDVHDNNTHVLPKEPLVVELEKPFRPNNQLHINLPFIKALAQMPKYAKFLKGLLTNKARLKEACKIIMNERCSAVLLNKLPSKEKDLGSFTIPCDIGQLHIDNALADLGASISLMPYTMYKKLDLGEPKATRMSLELANRSIQYPRGIIENILIKVDKLVLLIDFVILDMPEDSRVPIILGRPFLTIARAMIDVFNKKITLRVRDDEVIFDVDQSIKRPTTKEDECYGIDDLDDTINDEAQELLENKEPDSFLSRGLEKSIDQSDLERCEFASSNGSENSIRRIDSANTLYPVTQGTTKRDDVKSKHLYSASANEIKGISPSYCTYKILMEDDYKLVIQPQRRLNPKVQDVLKNKNVKLLDSGLIYPISDRSWVSPIHVVPKKGGMTVVLNDNNELIPSRTVTGWKVCIDYRKLNDSTRKDHFPLLFIDQMLERLYGNEYYCFLDGFSGFFQIPIIPEDQEKTTFTCPYGTFAYRRMPFRLCNAPATFQRCMTAIFHDMVEDFMEVFMDDFSEKFHFMVKEGIVLGHKISGARIEVDRAKIDVIAKLPYPTNVKGVRCFLRHAGFYRRFIKDYSMISKPMTQLLMKDARFDFFDDCKKAFNILKEKLTTATIIISPDWNVPFELMCDASDFAIGLVLGQRIDGKFKPIYYASKTLNNAQEHYTTTEKELLAVVFSFDKFRQYLILSKTVVYIDHSALKYLFSKEDVKPRLIGWVLLLQGFDIEIKDKKGQRI